MPNINIIQKTELWNHFRFLLPMIICATWVIINQRKLIWNTLKIWWNWSWNFQDWPSERIDYLKIFGLGVLAFCTSVFLFRSFGENLVQKQQIEVVEKMYEEKLIDKNTEQQRIQEIKNVSEPSKKPIIPFPFYDIHPIISFVMIVLIAPIVEECICRYLVFEIFSKDNPLAYTFSGVGFIFLHWNGSTSGLLTLTTIKLLLISYFPMTILFIYAYRKSKWNITYPIFFHFFWNFIVFMFAIIAISKI